MERLLTPQSVITFILVMTRVAGVIGASPFFNAQGIPRNIKVFLAGLLAFIIYPAVPPVIYAPQSILHLLFAVVTQALYGLLVGFAVTLIFIAFQTGGNLIDLQMGLGMAQVMDPTTGYESSLVSRWLSLLAVMIFLGVNGHHWLILGLINSFKLAPLEYSFLTQGFIDFIIRSFADILRVALNCAAPILIAVILLDIVTGFIAKTAPKLNVLFIMIPFKISLGFVILSLSFAGVAMTLGNLLTRLKDPILRLFYI